MDLPLGQLKRLDRMRRERHYLLDLKLEKEKSVLSISGSTGNIYTIQIDQNGIECDCPDFCGYAEADGYYCKHCCFVIYRILSSNLTSNDVDPRRISKEKLAIWQEALAKKSPTQLSHVISPILCQKYAKMCKSDNTDLPKFGLVSIDQCKKKEKLEDSCGICYEDLQGAQMLVECGECFNLLHKDCADIWLRKGTVETCVYCRAPLAYAFSLQNDEQVLKRRKKQDLSDYQNILE